MELLQNLLSNSPEIHKNCIAIKEANTENSLTYDEVWTVRNLFASFIQNTIKDENQCIGLLTVHNLYVPSIVLGLLKLNHTFIVLDPYADCTRNSQVIQALELCWILHLPDVTVESELLKNFVLRTSVTFSKVTFNLFESEKHTKTEHNFKDICYTVCTSGTTGVPKVVRVSHESIFSNIKALKEIFNTTANDFVYFGTNLTFDPSMVELFLSLASGATLVIVPKNVQINSSKLLKLLFPRNNNDAITVLQMPPSLFLRWTCDEIEHVLQNTRLRVLALGGEKFPNSILKIEKSKDLKIFNLYGITEVSCWASILQVTDNDVHLGRSLPNTVLQVRDKNGVKVVNGEGELFIGSRTRICLINDELNPELPIFRATGDLVNINNDKIYFLGRKQDSLKRNGIKISLELIEQSVSDLTNLEMKCFSKEINEKTKLLLIFLIQDLDYSVKDKIVDKLRVKLLHGLPKEWFPDFIDVFRSFPLTSNGKIDESFIWETILKQKRLEKLEPVQIFDDLLEKYFGLTELQLKQYKNCTFFELGGNSIVAIQFLEQFKILSGREYPRELITYLIENTLEECRNCISSMCTKRHDLKRSLSTIELTNDKRIKLEGLLNANVTLRIVWKYDLHACVDCPASVLKTGNQIIVAVGSFSNIFAVLDGRTGREISKVVLPDVIQSACCFSPDETSAFIGCFDGRMYCVDLKTGALVRDYMTGGQIKCTPSLCLEDECIVFGSYDKHVHCVRINDFEPVWKTDLNESVSANVICFNDKLFVATINGTFYCLESNTGEVFWKTVTSFPVFQSPVLTTTRIFWPTACEKIVCLNTRTGEHALDANLRGTSLCEHKNHLICGSNEGTIDCVSLANENRALKLKYRVSLGAPIYGAPCIANEFVVVATTSGAIYLLEFASGECVANVSLPKMVFSAPRACDNFVYVGCRDNNLYCIDVGK